MTEEKVAYGPFSIDDEEVESPSIDDEYDGYNLNKFKGEIDSKKRRKRILIFLFSTVFVVVLSTAFRTRKVDYLKKELNLESSTPSSSVEDELKNSVEHASIIKKNLSEKKNILEKKPNQALDLSSFESKPKNSHDSGGKYSNLDHDPLSHHSKPGMVNDVKQSQATVKNEDDDEFHGASYRVIEEIDRDPSSFT